MTDRHLTRLWAFIIVVACFALLREGLAPGADVLGAHDTTGAFVPWWAMWRESLAAGQFPLWDVAVGSGYPFFADPQVALFYPPAWLALILSTNAAVGWFSALHIAFGGVGMLLFTRSRDATPHAAGMAGLAFALSGFFAARLSVGHIGVVAVLVWAPWLLYATLRAVRQGTVHSALIASLTWAGAVLAGHITSLVYVVILWVSFTVLLLSEEPDRIKVVRQVVLIGLVGTLLASIQMLPFIEVATYSERAAALTLERATQWSLPPAQLMTLILPTYFGEPVIMGYWGGLNFEELTIYAGLLPAVAALAALGQPNRRTMFWLALLIFGLWVALGRFGGLYAFLWDYLPGFQLIRVPGRAGFLYVFAAPVLLADLLSRERTTGGWVALGGGVLLLGGLAIAATSGDWGAATLPPRDPAQLAHRAGLLSRALLLLSVGGVLVIAYHIVPPRWQNVPAGLLAGLLLFDLWSFSTPLIRTVPAEPIAYWQKAAEAIDAQPESPGRVIPWGLGGFDWNTAGRVGLQNVYIYNPITINHMFNLVQAGDDPRDTVYDVLAVHYILTSWPGEQYKEGERVVTTIYESDEVWVHRRAVTLPLVRHTPEVVTIPDDQAAIDALLMPSFDPAQTAITATPVNCDNSQPARLAIEEARPGYWRIQVEAIGGPAYIVVAETDYPGWRALIDGERVDYQRAYTALRGVCVPEGAHTLEWRFRPASLYLGGGLTLLTLTVGGAAVLRMKHTSEAAI